MNYLFGALILVCLLFGLTGCLKDEPLDEYENLDPIVLIPNANWPAPAGMVKQIELPGNEMSAVVKLYGRVSWRQALDHDVQVMFRPNPSLIQEYNTAAGSDYVSLPADAYTMTVSPLIIPAGKQEAYLPVTILIDKMDRTKHYMLAFSISKAEGHQVADNFRSVLFPFIIK